MKKIFLILALLYFMININASSYIKFSDNPGYKNTEFYKKFESKVFNTKDEIKKLEDSFINSDSETFFTTEGQKLNKITTNKINKKLSDFMLFPNKILHQSESENE